VKVCRLSSRKATVLLAPLAEQVGVFTAERERTAWYCLKQAKKELVWVEEWEGMKNGNKDGGARVITEKNAPPTEKIPQNQGGVENMSIGGQSDAKPERRIYRLTPEGFAKMQQRLEYLRNVRRKEVADYIHEAKEAGDISESSAYEDAKNEQAKVEGEILELEQLLSAAEIMTPDMHGNEEGPRVVRIGMQVKVETESGAERTFKIVETFEANPKEGLISDQSPVGKALMGHKEGEEVTVSTPGGVTTYLILEISPML
jgi:transcription elongation factor GreA